jgi:phosphoribosylformylglycinamidine cyclo-ligase
MCVNDVICSGAKPLFFLDYVAVGRNHPEVVASIVSGVAEGCVQAGCALIGGETAEMPGFYPADEYDLAGFAVGMADREKILEGNDIVPGDALIGLASSGVHSNGFSLVRKVLNVSERNINLYIEELGHTLGEELLTPTKIYVKPVLALMEKVHVKAMSHITGGGFYENVPRMLREGVAAKIEKAAVPQKPIFAMLQKAGNIPEHDMYNTFNMGVGMCLTVAKENANRAVEVLEAAGQPASVIGEIVEGEKGVELC